MQLYRVLQLYFAALLYTVRFPNVSIDNNKNTAHHRPGAVIVFKLPSFLSSPHNAHIVHLLATESTGALSPDVIRLLRELAKTAQGTSGHDSTVYGLSRASPKSFFPHHLAAISSAIVCADARSIRNHAASLATQLSRGMI